MTPLLEYPDGGAVDVVAARPDGVPEQLPLPRIDFVLASPALAERCTYARWYCDDALLELSDHPPVLADFAAPAAPANRK